jgi:hypothetical protein
MNSASMVTSEGDLSPELENMPVTDTCNDIRYVQSNIYLLFLPQNQFHSYACNSNISSLRSLCLYSNPSQVAKPALIDTNEGQNGLDKGAESSVYLAAWAFFKQRELRGIKLPSTSAKKDEKESVPSVNGIVLEGEVDGKVSVYGEFRNPNSMCRQGINGSRYMRRRAP